MTRLSAALVDSTLREGDQTPGVVLSRKDKILIAESLIDAGIKELEAGIPVMGQDEVELLKDLSHLQGRIICWCRAHPEDVKAAKRAGTGAIHISLPVSDCLLNTMGFSWSWVLDQVGYWGKELQNGADFLSLGAMDASRCDSSRLKAFLKEARKAGFNRVRLADTVGIALPSTMRTWAREFWSFRDILEFHGHNDLGMAVANTICAVEEGFSAVSMTLLGLGERAGNAPLEEVLLALQVGLDLNSSVDLQKISHLARKLSVLTGQILPGNKPLLGDRINKHESGIHVAGLKKNPQSFKPYDPVCFGGSEEQILWGRHSGRHSLEWLLDSMGLPAYEGEGLLTQVKARSEELKRGLGKNEVLEIYNMMTAKGVC